LESGGGRQRRERLTEDQRKELRQMRKRQRAEHRKRKILKLDEEGVSLLPDCQLRICCVSFVSCLPKNVIANNVMVNVDHDLRVLFIICTMSCMYTYVGCPE
jgi:hypothetical protein